MCGRLSQHREMEAYWSQLPVHPFVDVGDFRPSYNVPPGTRPLALHPLGGHPETARLFWSYKPPWFISAHDAQPIYMAGITAWQPGREMLAENGFAIITDDSAGGIVDIHDRRPIALTPEYAAAWIDPELPVGAALELLSTPRP